MPTEDQIKFYTMIGAAIAFIWGVFQFLATQRSQAQTRRVEATRPFLDKQLVLYTDATRAVATLATSSSEDEMIAEQKRFWELYWGELAMVEDKRVESAMVDLKDAFDAGKVGDDVKDLSLNLAHACRDSLADSWGVKHWRNPHS